MTDPILIIDISLSGPAIPDYEEMWISVDWPEPGRYTCRITKAPPRCYISAEVLQKAMEGELVWPHLVVSGHQLDVLTFTDDVGQRFIYRLGDYEALYDAFLMEWPD